MTPAWDPAYDLSHPLRADVDGAPSLTFVCRHPACGKTFQLKGNLKRHQNIHRGDKQFRCDVCGREFLRKADRDVHRRVHTGEKPYTCRFPHCDKSFARRSDLLSHERTHSGKKPFACDFPGCGKRFARRFDLHKHQRMHGGATACRPEATRASAKRQRCDADVTTDRADKAGRKVPPISPSDPIDGPAKQVLFELTCTQDHEHIPEDCFAALDGATIEDWDALLASCGVPVCCPDHRASGIQQHLAQRKESAGSTPGTASISDAFQPFPVRSSGAAADGRPVPSTSGTASAVAPTSSFASSVSSPSPSPSSCSPSSTAAPASTCPIVTTAKLHDYSAHTSCGHLSIQHGDHRDFVVKNHLVCLDSVKSISGDCGGGGASGCSKPVVPPVAMSFRAAADHAANASAMRLPQHQHHHPHPHAHPHPHPRPLLPRHSHDHSAARGAGGVLRCRAPEDPHRPGCGHLPVRHRDHIDYVVEDNLFCQYAGLLADGDAQDEDIELLDDDFWEFYGAIGSMNTTEA
ncbi:hypothetical protein ATCC90586_002615 [Pythium insidiosum]|nr:hypothetical protein ATCC90586_002615 [Pythium insidiosum]